MDSLDLYMFKSEQTFSNEAFPFMMFRTLGETHQTMHSHDYVQMWYVKRGRCHHYFNGSDFELYEGNLFIVPPYMEHYLESDCHDCELITCEFSEDFMRIAGKDDAEHLFDIVYLEPILIHCKSLKPSLYFRGNAAKDLESLFGELEREYNRQDNFYSTIIRANVLRLLTLIARQYDELNSSSRNEMFSRYRNAINQALQYINEHFCEKIYLEDVCRISLMSPSAFSSIFKHITGTTFTEYLLRLRISKVRDLIINTARPITDICFECGFNDPAYFHRTFKKITGSPPGKFRKNEY